MLWILFIFTIFFPLQNISGQYELIEAFPQLNFTNPVDIQNAGDGTDRIFIVEQAGIIKVFQNDPDVNSSATFLNLSSVVSSGGERGLLGLAFHPDYENIGYFFVNYTAAEPLRTIVSRFSVHPTNPNNADINSETILIEFNQLASNHNAGQLAFGPDGYLYISTGDGGNASQDPNNQAKDLSSFHGKILRIEVNSTEQGLNYAIPDDNPYKGNSQNFKEEIYAYGFRNPWRFSFDAVTGELWCADVGEDDFEEINIVNINQNFGWNCYEGTELFSGGNCSGSNIEPIYQYDLDGQSITGGYVYRGNEVAPLIGKYIFADFMHRIVWALTLDGNNNPTIEELTVSDSRITSFGVSENNELFLAGFSPNEIYKFEPIPVPVELVTFQAVFQNDAVLLQWNTAVEIDNYGFEIYRAEELKINSWEKIGFVKGHGNSNSYKTYQFIDEKSFSSQKIYYKLKQLDNNGDYEHSEIIEVTIIPQKFELKQNFPNPFNPETKIRYTIPYESDISLKIYDVMGREMKTLIQEKQSEGFYEVIWDGTNSNGIRVSSGIYIFKLKNGSISEVKKMILIN